MARFTLLKNLFDGQTSSLAGSGVGNLYIDTSMAKQMSVQFSATAISGGSGVLEIQISNDATNWVTYNRLTTNATNTNAQTDIGVSSITLSATGSSIYFIRNGDHFRFMRGSLLVNTNGSYTATVVGVD